MNHPKKKLRALHRALWSWMMKHPGADKEHWPGWKAYEKCLAVQEAFWAGACFACLYSEEHCRNCPIIERAGYCTRQGSLFWELSKYMGKNLNRTEEDEWYKLCRRMKTAWH